MQRESRLLWNNIDSKKNSARFFGGKGRHLLTSGQYHRSTYVNYAFYVVPFDSLTTNEDYLQTDK